MCYGAKTTVVEVEELVEVGDIDQMLCIYQGFILITYLLERSLKKKIEKRTVKEVVMDKMTQRMKIIRRAAQEIKSDMVINLGIVCLH